MTFNDYVSPACILRDNSKFHGQNCYVAGWGQTETGLDAEILLSVNVELNMNECWGALDKGQICAGGGPTKEPNKINDMSCVALEP